MSLIQSEGAFLSVIRAGNIERMRSFGSEIVGEDFANALAVLPSDEVEGAMIVFEKPMKPVACYHAFVVNHGGSHQYFTLEMAFDLLGTGSKTVIGEWTSDGAHLNLGFRNFS